MKELLQSLLGEAEQMDEGQLAKLVVVARAIGFDAEFASYLEGLAKQSLGESE